MQFDIISPFPVSLPAHKALLESQAILSLYLPLLHLQPLGSHQLKNYHSRKYKNILSVYKELEVMEEENTLN